MTETIQFIQEKFKTPAFKKWGTKETMMAKQMTIFVLSHVLNQKKKDIATELRCGRKRIWEADRMVLYQLQKPLYRAILLKLLSDLDERFPEKGFGDFRLPPTEKFEHNKTVKLQDEVKRDNRLRILSGAS